MRIVLEGLLWRCPRKRNVAVLTGELFGPAPPGGGRAKSLGKCAFSGKWPVSDVNQLGVKTVVRARSLDLRAERSHLGDLPLYAIDEQWLTPVHAGEDSAAEKGCGASSGVAKPCAQHAAMLPRAPPRGHRYRVDIGPSKTPEERADAGKAVPIHDDSDTSEDEVAPDGKSMNMYHPFSRDHPESAGEVFWA